MQISKLIIKIFHVRNNIHWIVNYLFHVFMHHYIVYISCVYFMHWCNMWIVMNIETDDLTFCWAEGYNISKNVGLFLESIVCFLISFPDVLLIWNKSRVLLVWSTTYNSDPTSLIRKYLGIGPEVGWTCISKSYNTGCMMNKASIL